MVWIMKETMWRRKTVTSLFELNIYRSAGNEGWEALLRPPRNPFYSRLLDRYLKTTWQFFLHLRYLLHGLHENPIYVFTEKKFCGQFPISNFQFPISTIMCLWAIYIFPGLGQIFSCSRIRRPIMVIYKSLTDTWMLIWDWCRAIPFLGIFV